MVRTLHGCIFFIRVTRETTTARLNDDDDDDTGRGLNKIGISLNARAESVRIK